MKNNHKRLLTAFLFLVTLTFLTIFIINFEVGEPWHKQPLVAYIKTGLLGRNHLVQPIYVDGQNIGAFYVDSSLQKDYIIKVAIEETGAGSGSNGNRKVLNLTFHALGKAVEKEVNTKTTTPLPTTINPNLPHFLCPNFKGRLGNTLFIFGSVFGLAAQSNLSVVLPKSSKLWKLFRIDKNDLVNITNDDSLCKEAQVHIDSGACCKYNQNLLSQIKGRGSVHIKGYLQSYRYFEGVEHSLRKALVVTPEYQNKSSQALLKALQTRYNSSTEWQGRTFVGVHVRRGDFLTSGAAKFGHVAAEEDYYKRAMEYFDSHFPNVTFVICSDTLDWARANVRHNHSVVVESGSELVDFAVLTRMNHTLMSTGSFSWWAAWLANGTAVYLKEFLKKGTTMATQFNPKGEDHVLPDWIPM